MLLVLLGIILWKFAYQLVLYPMFFTPLKHIPTPSVSSPPPIIPHMTEDVRLTAGFVLTPSCQSRNLLTGNTKTYFPQTPWPEIKEWATSLPHEGLIRYYVVGNLERIVVTSPKALSELLVTKVYDFEKPKLLRQNLRRIVGDGVLLAEGDEHKVLSPDPMNL